MCFIRICLVLFIYDGKNKQKNQYRKRKTKKILRLTIFIPNYMLCFVLLPKDGIRDLQIPFQVRCNTVINLFQVRSQERTFYEP